MNLLGLPVVMIENILSYLSYDEIAKSRIISKAFNVICMKMLNRGFLMIEKKHSMALKNVKAQLPRRESERRYHHLSRHCDILTSIETRISMLNMTYAKFIDNGLCCFIPGKVIDEIMRVLSVVEVSTTPPRAHEVLQELRDISSMAIEHFDDKISPAFRKILQESGVQQTPRPNSANILAPLALRVEMNQLRRRTVLNGNLILCLASKYKKFQKRMIDYRKLACRHHRTIGHLLKKNRDQNAAIADLKKRIEECDIKYSELTHTNQAAGGKAIGSDVATAAAQPLRHFSSQIKLDLSVLPIGTSKKNPNKKLPNIKPRKSVLKLPSLMDEAKEDPPKANAPEEDRPNPVPSTSRAGLRARTASGSAIASASASVSGSATAPAKTRSLANELRALADTPSDKDRKAKRPLNRSAGDTSAPEKKKKLE